MGQVDAIIDRRLRAWIDELVELCAIPSEFGRPDALGDAAAWVAERFRAAGATVRELALDGGAPFVAAELGDGDPTVISVQHYDVQPAGDPSLWTSPPYAPTMLADRLVARGATDNKGVLLARLWGLEAYVETVGRLPATVRFLVEGEEEQGSSHLAALLDANPGLRGGDCALIEGGLVDEGGRPHILAGMRGLLVVEITVRTLDHDAHSAHAMLLPNAIERLVAVLRTLYDDTGVPTFSGFWDDVRAPTPSQAALVRVMPDDDLAALRTEYGLSSLLAGRTGVAAHMAVTFEPTCNLQGIWGGHTGDGYKTIVPGLAGARIDLRLVPDQDPDRVLDALRRHLAATGFDDVIVTRLPFGFRPYFSPPDHAVVGLAARVSSEVLGQPAVIRVAEAGAGPMYDVCAPAGTPMASLGAGRDDCRAHAPDEHVRIDDLALTARMMARFVHDIGADARMDRMEGGALG